jgi:hypothetical protein
MTKTNENPITEKLFTLRQASQYCRLAPESLRNYVQAGIVPGKKLPNGRWVMTLEAVQFAANGGRNKPKPKQDIQQ